MTPSRILIADSDPESGQFLQSCLVRAGYSVPGLAASGGEALERGRQTSPDLAILNASLPGEPGALETARILIESLHVPVLFFAPGGGDFSLNRGKAPFGAGYLAGPVSESELLAAVTGALGRGTGMSSRQRGRKLLAQVLESLPEPAVATDFAGLVVCLNAGAGALLGVAPAELEGKPLAPALEAGRSRFQVSSAPLEQSDGSISGCVYTLRPSAGPERQTAPDLAASLPDALLLVNPEQRVVRLNPAAAALLAAPAPEILGTPLWDHLPAGCREKHGAELELAIRDQSRHSFQLHLENGEAWWQARVFPAEGNVLLALQDITGQKRAAEDAERVARLEGLSHLARGFTHDFNNLLTILMGNLTLARAQAGPGEMQRLLEESEAATRRARDLVEQLTTFAKGGAPIKGMIPLRPLVNEVLGRRPASSRIAYQARFEGPEFTLEADPKQLRRMLENLILNAEQAISGKGEIDVRCFHPDEPEGVSPSPWVVIEVRDSGSGMPEETVRRAFEPFFTTRAQVNATGLGLTVCESIAKAHGGIIRLLSTPGEGTVAHVRLPVRSPESQARPAQGRALNGRAPNGAGPLAGKAPRILVLEDETLIRRLIHSTLSQAGFEVDETWDGRQTIEAYRCARENGRPYDLLIMDLAIENGMGGVEAMDRIRSLDPAALAIVSSGYSDDPAMSRPGDFGFTSVLPKPYEPRHLVEAVQRLLAERSAAAPAAP